MSIPTLEQYFAATYQKRQFGVSGPRITGSLVSPPEAMLNAEAASLSPTQTNPN